MRKGEQKHAERPTQVCTRIRIGRSRCQVSHSKQDWSNLDHSQSVGSDLRSGEIMLRLNGSVNRTSSVCVQGCSIRIVEDCGVVIFDETIPSLQKY